MRRKGTAEEILERNSFYKKVSNPFSVVEDWIQISRCCVSSCPLSFAPLPSFYRILFLILVSFHFFCSYFLSSCSFSYYLLCFLLFFTISSYIQCLPSALFSSFIFLHFCLFIYFALHTFRCTSVCYFSSFVLFFLSAGHSLSFLCFFSWLPKVTSIRATNLALPS